MERIYEKKEQALIVIPLVIVLLLGIAYMGAHAFERNVIYNLVLNVVMIAIWMLLALFNWLVLPGEGKRKIAASVALSLVYFILFFFITSAILPKVRLFGIRPGYGLYSHESIRVGVYLIWAHHFILLPLCTFFFSIIVNRKEAFNEK
ncbi:hypothetical protein GTO91_04270 [Heliobacterium undosum]|uniref:Uncharacterized protein n=1 Tax=Heliomicrobium undosum TaxID=121734 RepID=A0A845L269_9FIRM|nr:hypothetical protein [Heliomicrobium undosum]MZP28924.1 hypothetical protein [Heliomicrobium undosum]